MFRIFAISLITLTVVACATVSPRMRIENRFVEFGLSEDKARCMGNELDDRLNRSDLKAVADFIGNINEADSPGQSLDALISIENPRAAGAIARAGIACAFS
ncbi:hypothetical protein [Hyphococcus lacteus]|uniref:Lipoprotein n=1 Tax=Hyphococcus lacteus TaxID=3143536 RepID=A0ABV3Z4R5_9PROT